MNRGFTTIASPQILYPQSIILFPTNFSVLQGCGGNITVQGAGSLTSAFDVDGIQATPGLGDVIAAPVACESGVYDFIHMGSSFSNRGILGYELDGIRFLTGQDWYSAGAVYNVQKTGQVNIAHSGTHLLKITVEGKNASSSTYYLIVGYITLVRRQVTFQAGA